MAEINLDSIIYDQLVTRDAIFKLLTQEEIYSYYIGYDISNMGIMCSPFRDDNVPSFSIYYHKSERNILMYHDFATKDSGDCIVFVMKLFGITYEKALLKIAYDFKLSSFNIGSYNKEIETFSKLKEKKVIEIGIKKREWFKIDQQFWQQFAIRKSTLERFNVCPVEFVFYNGNAVKAEPLAYAYKEWKDGILTYKIYQPLSPNKKFKWINNANYSVHQGYTQLPETGDLLIITKSLKDVMSIYDTLSIYSIGLQSESVMMKDSVMKEYKTRFKKVICLFDNDTAGEKLALSFTETYSIPFLSIPKLPGVTDYSDLIKHTGVENATKTFNNLLKNLE